MIGWPRRHGLLGRQKRGVVLLRTRFGSAVMRSDATGRPSRGPDPSTSALPCACDREPSATDYTLCACVEPCIMKIHPASLSASVLRYSHQCMVEMHGSLGLIVEACTKQVDHQTLKTYLPMNVTPGRPCGLFHQEHTLDILRSLGVPVG
jgi:hypothetical protein